MVTKIDTLGRNLYSYHSIVVDSSGDVWTLYRTYYTTYRMMLFKNATQMEDVADDDIHGSGETMYWCTMCIDSSDVIHIFCLAAPAGATRDLAYATYTISTSTLSSWTEIASMKTAYTSTSLQCAINSNDDIFVMYGYNPKNGQVYMCTDESGSWVEYEIGSDGKSYIYQGGGIGIDGNDDIWFHYRNATSSLSCYRIWDSSASSLGSEQTQSAPSGTTNYYPIQDVLYNGSNVYFWWHPYQTITGEEPWKQTIDSGSFTNNPCTVEEDDFWRSRATGSSGNFTYWNGKLAYVGSYYGYQGIALYTLEAGGWTYQYDIGGPGQTDYEDHQVRCATPNSTPSSNLGGNLYYVFTRYDTTASDWYPYIDIIYPGTPTDDNRVAFTFGGGTPSDNQSAYMLGRERYSYQSAYMYGSYDVGGNTRDAIHASVPTRAPFTPAFTQGDLKFYFDVVPFNCSTGTGTQNITGNLGGNQPAMAFFTGSGTTSDHVMTADARFFLGWTDGTDEYCVRAYLPDAQASSSATQGTVTSGACAGSSYGTGGSAAFNSWLTNGVQINWTAGAATAWDAAALLIGCDNNSVGIKTASGSIDPSATAETGDIIEVLGLGFKPDMVLTFVPQGGMGAGMGVAGYDDEGKWTRGAIMKDWNSGYFNWPGSCGVGQSTDTYDWWNVADGISSGSDNVGRWGCNEPVSDNLLEFYCDGNDGSYNLTAFYWIAFKLEPPGKVRWDYHVYSDGGYGGLSVDYDMRMNVDAVLGLLEQSGDVNYPSHYGTFGSQMFDGTHEWSCCVSCITGGSPWTAKSVGDTTKIGSGIVQKDGPTLQGTADFTQWNTSGWKSWIDSTGGDGSTICRTRSIAFGNNYPVDASTPAYLRGHSRFQFAHTWGKINTTSSTSAFFHVVDAQDFRHCYLEGLDPSRSDTPAFAMGFDNPLIIPVEFTAANASGTQDITSPNLNGNQPVAAIFFLFGANSYSATHEQDCLISWGMTTGSSMAKTSGGRAKSDTTYYFDGSASWAPDALMVVPKADPYTIGRVAQASFSSWITNGIRISWDNAPGDTYKGVVLFFVGNQISVAYGKIDHPLAVQDVAVTSPGFEPDLLLCLNVPGPVTDSTVDVDVAAYSQSGVYAMWGINDERTPLPSQPSQWCSFGRGVWSMGAEPELYTTRTGWLSYTPPTEWGGAYYKYYWLKSFDANGFTVHFDSATQPGTAFDINWLAIKLDTTGKRKVFWPQEYDGFSIEAGKTYTFIDKPQGSYNIVPETFIGFGGFAEKVPLAYGNYVASQTTDDNMLFIGGAVNRMYSNNNAEAFWDYYSQLVDQVSRSFTSSTYNLVWHRYSFYNHFWWNQMEGTLRPIRNGYSLEVTNWDTDNFDEAVGRGGGATQPFTLLNGALVFGLAEYYSSTEAYMKGDWDDWRGRTPRGCYLEGTVPGVNSSTDAFIEGKAPAIGSTDAYINGQDNAMGSRKVFLRGMDSDIDNISAFLAGGINVLDSTPAWCRSGWDVEDNQSAFLEGVPSRSSAIAYAEGFSPSPSSSKSAFTGGGGPWPFTDDFTGADEDPWNASKWISTEEL